MLFDYENNILTITDEEGNISTEKHDMKGNVIERKKTVDGIEIVSRLWYDGLGQNIASEGPVPGAVTSKEYNSLGQVVLVKMPESEFYENGSYVTLRPEISYTYDAAGRQIAEIISAPSGGERVTITTYDGLGRQIHVEQKGSETAGGTLELLAENKFFYDYT